MIIVRTKILASSWATNFTGDYDYFFYTLLFFTSIIVLAFVFINFVGVHFALFVFVKQSLNSEIKKEKEPRHNQPTNQPLL